MTSMMLSLNSRNAKVGPIPVSTTSNDTCPDACPLKHNGCYADGGPLGMMWAKLSQTTAGETFKHGSSNVPTMSWATFVERIAALPEGQLWRHNQAGDLPGHGDTINRDMLDSLVDANEGKRGFTYTHKPLTADSLAAITSANLRGFTVNLSANNLAEADTLAATGLPTVVVLPDTIQGNVEVRTPAGRRVSVCPATYHDNVSCSTCQLCQRQNRKAIIGFPAHGVSKRKASNVANS